MKIKNQSGLIFEFLENGSLRTIEDESIRVSIRPATLFSRSLMNIFLRKRASDIQFTPLLGPESLSQYAFQNNNFYAKGTWQQLEYICKLELSEHSKSWKWSFSIQNKSEKTCELDLIYVQDVGLKSISDALVNEYYVSQYLERIVLHDSKFGAAVCCRQNMKESSGHPWMMIASTGNALTASTDGMQFFGNSYRETGIPEGVLHPQLRGNMAGESSIVAIQEKPFNLESGKSKACSFAGTLVSDHPEASSRKDLAKIESVLQEFPDTGFKIMQPEWITPQKNIFNATDFLPAEHLTNKDLSYFFGDGFSNVEKSDLNTLSFFTENSSHVVLKAKEIIVDRPHGHILQANTGFEPGEDIVSTTCYATGIFNTHISQGNTNFNVLLSVYTSPFNLQTETGQRMFVETDGQIFLLGMPSAFEMGLNYCRWIYKYKEAVFQIRTWTSISSPVIYTDFKVLTGPEVRLIITQHFDQSNSWAVSQGASSHEFLAVPAENSMIKNNFPKAQFRFRVFNEKIHFAGTGTKFFKGMEEQSVDPLFILDIRETKDFYMSIIGEIMDPHSDNALLNADEQWKSDYDSGISFWNELSLGLLLNGNDKDSKAINEILPWYGMNALVHFLTPYGLEQFSGAAWGTRDVAQGPIELLINTGKYAEARKVLLHIFANQNPEADWPQWWMFDSYRNIRAGDCHGDVYYWVLIALANYIKTTDDLSILAEKVPYYGDPGKVTPVAEHVDRLIRMITDSYIEGTSFVPFGGGDWNDSLQPVSPELSKRLISSWTVMMNYQAFKACNELYLRHGNLQKADELNRICENIRQDLNKYLIKDGVIAGYGYVEDDQQISVLLHPRDSKTGIQYSILPMNRGIISGIFTKEQALSHQKIIDAYLKGPDGARLMDRPLKYKGGVQEIFQRAESSTFFGREIGLMYIHEHIRYAESQALLGKADEFIHALRQAIPVAYQEIVECGDFRQSNCYYSSSDVYFTTRYEADEKYHEILEGKQLLKGGWRVYSSGPGIYISLIISKLLGIRIEADKIIFDPVISKNMDGLTAGIRIKSFPAVIKYRVFSGNYSPKKIWLNGEEIGFEQEKNRYRDGGAVIDLNKFLAKLNLDNNSMEIEL